MNPFDGFGVGTGLPFYPFLFVFPFIVILAVWSIAIKGYALWVAAGRGEKWWFIAILLINTIGLLELFYLLVIVHQKVKLFSNTSPIKTEEHTSEKK